MGENFVEWLACTWQYTSFAIKLILTVSILIQPNPSTAQGCPSALLGRQIKSHQMHAKKKKASAANGVGHQPATMLWSLRKPSSDAHDMISAATLWFLVVKATATSSPPAMLWPDA